MNAANEQTGATHEQTPQVIAARPPSATFTGMSLSAGAIQPKSMGELLEFAKLVASSGMVPKDYLGNPGAVLVAMQMGAELGLSPMASLQNIAVINGRPSVWGDAALAIVRTHRDFVDIQETQGDGWARCVIVRRGKSHVDRMFTRQDAETAKLWGKSGPWSQYPQRMLQMRARWFAMRDAFPDALRGISPAEEASDVREYDSLDASSSPHGVSSKATPLSLAPAVETIDGIVQAFEAIGVSRGMLERRAGGPLEQLGESDIAELTDLYAAVRQNPKRKVEEFGAAPSAAASINQRLSAPPTNGNDGDHRRG